MWAMQTSLHDMFFLGLPVIEKMVRPVLVYAFLVVALRLSGKRELAQLNPFDLVVLLTLSNTVQNAIIGEDNSVTGGLLGASTLLVANHLVVRYLYRHRRLDRIVEGSPDVLIQHGKIVKQSLGRELITENELLTAARRQGFDTLADIDRAILDANGAIVFYGKKPQPDEARHADLVARLDRILAAVSTPRSAA
jgi:uncharacterized membrane protein YcaP (DUF421 family)